MESPLQKMIDKQVIVKTGDVTYRGRLVEVTEDSVCMMAKTGWREVLMERVVSIDLLPEPKIVETDEDLPEESE